MSITARIFQLAALLCLGASLFPASTVRADTVTASTEAGYIRLLFTLTPAAQVKAAADNGVLTLAFDRKVGLDPASIVAALNGLASAAHEDSDGKTLRFALSQQVRLHVSEQGERAAVDLAPLSFAGTMPDLKAPPPPIHAAVDIKTLPVVKLRAGAYANFTRLVFDWDHDVPYTVFPGAGRMTIRFGALVQPDLSAITRFAPPWVKNAAWHIDGDATVVEFETDTSSGFHDFRDGTHVVLDILAPTTDASAYAPPGDAKPKATEISAAQVKAVADAAAEINAKPAPGKPATPDAKPTPVKTDSKPPVQQAAATPPATTALAAVASTTPPTPTADGALTRDGAVLTFKGSAVRGSAVFMRGLTAWIVLENAPEFDPKALKAALGDFPAGIDASSGGGGVSVLRITLKQPEQIAARGQGADLKVVIGPSTGDAALDIGFARNQDDPNRASLTTLLPGADRLVTLADPDVGDTLIVVPAGTGRAMTKTRTYAEFAALQSASGLVLQPLIDTLDVGVQDARISIAAPGGLKLTPPQLPVASTPAALAAAGGDGPSFLDFASWGVLSAGSFLATERRLEASVAQAKPADANKARLALACFFLANRFAAETLGLLDLMQEQDPALAGDRQLATMRAAANFMMGRYHDAHNAIADPAFDDDRHAALWRGLIEASLENWSTAHDDLTEAQPVLARYSAAMQAEAHLADADATLGMGRLELADAALRRLPAALDRPLALHAELARARIYAVEKRFAKAQPLFAAVIDNGTDPIVAQALYYRTVAALDAGAIKPQAAIDTLEGLRFRWRGDGIEMKTLRTLAALYFGQQEWRDGLRTLRVAADNFGNDDAARTAQDDMRAAFVNLYLKGAADKMPPIESLSLFYEFIDLTPIGPDGDEMIRHMADRLVAVDLLEPAADLLAYQVNKRLDGVARAQVAIRLASIYLLDNKPQSAIDILHGTAVSGLPDDVGHERLLLEARAFAGLKQWDNALDLIGADDAADSRRLRADIYWESGNWAVAGDKIEALLDTSWEDTNALSPEERDDALRAAVAYSLAGDEASLDRLRDHFAVKMKATPDGDAFALLSESIAQHGIAFRDAAAKIASVDTLENFMKNFGRRQELAATD